MPKNRKNKIVIPFQVRHWAVKRVKNALPIPKNCNCCKSKKIRIVHHSEIYGSEKGKWPWVYFCDTCHAYVGLHPYTHIPLGFLADKKTREARMKCKRPFEVLFKEMGMARADAYQTLADELGIKKESCHFGWFDISMCKKAKEAAYKIQNRIIFGDKDNKCCFIKLRMSNTEYYLPVCQEYSQKPLLFKSTDQAHKFAKNQFRNREYKVEYTTGNL